MNVAFYYMANAGGRLAGTVMSGLISQIQGLQAGLWSSCGFVIVALLLSVRLPEIEAGEPAHRSGPTGSSGNRSDRPLLSWPIGGGRKPQLAALRVPSPKIFGLPCDPPAACDRTGAERVRQPVAKMVRAGRTCRQN